jgi:hypothetical protein
MSVAWYRLPDLSRAVMEAVPPELGPVAHAVTLLGDPELLIGLLSLLYWNHRRRETVTVVGATFVALVAVLALKWAFLSPRPPMAVRPVPIEPGGYGFPSGHATSATAVYGGLALAYDWTRDRLKTVATVALVAAVALSRVVLGVHYLGDIVAGVLLGSAVLALLLGVIRSRPVVGFAAAFALSLPSLLLTGLTPDALLAVAGSLGGVVAVWWLDAVPPLRSRLEGAVLSAAGLVYVGVALAAASAVETLVPALLVVDFCMDVAIFMAPVAVGRLPDRWVGA